MKKIFYLLFLSMTLISCDLEDDNSVELELVVMPIESIDVPDSFVKGSTYVISMTYISPSDCYEFYNFSYQVDGRERTISVVNSFYDQPTCTLDQREKDVSMSFIVTDDEPYIFKFFKGIDENGQDEYYVVEVPVVD